jgi:tRNA threonylcarbamoyladenosine biosynthesis protein TsaE
MVTLISHSAEETRALGETWGRAAIGGQVIALRGDLGAGKTQLAKGIALGLGITERVRSPTFNLVNHYDGGRLPLFHVDLYRLESADQIMAAGLEEYFTPAGVSVIEWAERWLDAIGGLNPESDSSKPRLRRVHIETLTESERRITYEDSGA